MPTNPLGSPPLDILYQILAHLTVDLKVPSGGSTRESKTISQALARLARAHTSFTQPALACLWRSLPSQKVLEHVLCVLGIATRPRQKHRWHYPQMELCGTLADHESSWTRFQEYASLVREVVIDPFVGTPDIPPKVLQDTFWPQVVSALGNQTILPRLERATIRSYKSFKSCAFDTGVLCLLDPSISELNIVLPQISAEQQTRLQRALSACFSTIQDLEVLSLDVPVLTMDIGSIPRLHPRLSQLKLNRRVAINPNQLMLFASLPTLEHLSIKLNHLIPLNRPITFRRLRSIHVSSFELPAIGALITHMDAPQLRTFSLSESSRENEILSSHLRTLATKWPSLATFQWTSDTRVEPNVMHGRRRAGEPLAELISPLLSLRALHSFTANFRALIVPYSPHDFQTIAKAWPELETFCLYDSLPRAKEYADLEALAAFARHCPRLHTLHVPMLSFDRDTFAGIDSEALEPPAAHARLRELSVRHIVYPRRKDSEDKDKDKNKNKDKDKDRSQTRNLNEQLLGCLRSMFPSATLQYSVPIHAIPNLSQ